MHFFLYSSIFSIPLSFFSLRPAHLHTLSIMCETRRSEMPGQDSSARLKAFSSSSMAPIPPPHALLFSFSWRANRRTLNSTTYRAYHSLLHFTAALSTATVIKNDSVRVTVRCLIIYTRGESLRWECWVFLPLWRWERPALTDIVTWAASLPFLLPVKQIQSKTLPFMYGFKSTGSSVQSQWQNKIVQMVHSTVILLLLVVCVDILSFHFNFEFNLVFMSV